MSHNKRKLYQSKHPLGSYSFEAFLSGSWKAVEHIKIEGGTPTLHFIDNQKRVLKKSPASQQDNSSAKICLEPGWVDAKIRSVQRKRHVSECSCEYFVNLYVNQGRYDPEKSVLSKETKVVGINQISILQKLDQNPCEDQQYRWDLPEDCFKARETKLFAGKFFSDFSWLVVASALKQVSFCVRSVEGKIVYQILGCEHSSSSLNYTSLKHVNFRLDNGMLTPFVSHVNPSDNNKAGQEKDAYEDEISPGSCIEGLRRSKRRNIEPERYLGYDDVSKLNFGHVQTGLPKSNTRYDDLKADVDILANCLGKDIDACQNIKKINTCQEVVVNNSWAASGMVKLENVDERGHEAQLVKDSLPDGGGPVAVDQSFLNNDSTGNSRHENYVFSEYNRLTHSPELNRKIVHPWAFEPYDHQSEVPDHHQSVVRDSLPDGGGPVALDHSVLSTNITENSWHESCVFSEYDHLIHSPELNRKIVDPWTFESYDKSSGCYDFGTYLYLKNVDTTLTKEELPITDQWVEFKTTSDYGQNEGAEADEEVSEIDMLWKEMEIALASFYVFDNTEGSKAEVSSETKENSDKLCQHEFRLNEEIGIYCCRCGFVKTEIKDISPPFVQNLRWQQDEKQCDAGNSEAKAHENDSLHLLSDHTSTNMPASEENDIWGLIPKLTMYLIQSQRRLGACKEMPMVIPGVPKPTGDVRHLLDSLEKIQKWHSHPSVLVMSYSYFLRLMEDNSKFSHRKDMAEVLRKSPGVVILDEGHNPRSTESCLRKALMKVETELRILLSGTLFQNNFCEFFNTLCLARPRFIHEVLRELDPEYKGDVGRAGKKPNFMERRARRFFLDKIAKKIDSDDNNDERLEGLYMLRKITNGFIDVYDGGSSDNLPGLRVYTLLVNITDFQGQIFRALYEKVSNSNRYPLEVELLVTLGAIHPWLIKTAAFSDKFLTEAQLSELEKCKFDLKIGPKVRFVLSLVFRVVKEEKILVFFHYIAPMRLFVELFEKFFGWQSGREVLVLSGEQDLFERGRVIDKFEEPGGASKILLASITACSEGISLTAASRVILLESEWNPSRTRQAIARAFRPGQQRIVYVYQLLLTGTMEEEKFRKTTRKERVSRMIFSEDFVEGHSQWQAEKLEDDILREMIAEDKSKIFHMVMKDEKASTN
ncbi:hypothetical protein K1719_018151 [Acacia pycnantha]|nr:hypothetical protein K1719_018151 [Acacia pycnantha]